MSEFLTVRLSSQKSEAIQWLVWSTAQEEVIASGELDNWEQLSDLTAYAQQRTVIALVATSDVVLSQVEIPAGGARQLETMLPYLLEDEIAQDVDDLHFHILGKSRSDDGKQLASVCAIESQWLQEVLTSLQGVGINVQKVIPDVLALPMSASLTMAKLHNQYLIRKDSFLGLNIDETWLPIVAQSDWVKKGDDYLELHSYTPLPQLELSENQSWTMVEPALVMQLLTEQAISSKVNLLTGAFKPKSNLAEYWTIWKKAAIAAGIFVAVFSAYSVIQVNQLEQQAQAYRMESERIFRAALPGKTRIPTVTYLKRQMETEASRLSGGNIEESVIQWLAKMPPALRDVTSMTLQNIKFDGPKAEVRIQAQSSDFQSFERFREQLEQQFEVEQGQLNRSGQSVNGSYVLKRK